MIAQAPRSLDFAMGRFCRALRARGFSLTPAETLDALRALEVVDLADRAEVRAALRTVLTSRPEEVPVFDACFDAFWGLALAAAPAVNEVPLPPPPPAGEAPRPQAGRPVPGLLADGRPRREPRLEWVAADEGQPLEVPLMSDQEVLLEKDFSTFTAGELAEALRLTRRLARRLARRAGRRRRPARRGPVDLRRSLRRNLARGEVIELAYRKRRPRRARLVALCDVSGSMDLYSRFLVQFLYALQNGLGRVETFTFSTRLTRVTGCLRGRSFAAALERLGAVEDWSGGTRIGENLERFNREWAGRLLDRRAVVLVLSDGWDTGDPELLARELLAIRRRARTLIWLNPLLGQSSYEPLAQGMAAALPLVHHFLPAHNLASLGALERYLRA